MIPFAKDYVERIVPYVPGKPIEEVERELGVRAVKLASNENPLGPSPKAIRATRSMTKQVHLYPDGGCSLLKSKLAAFLGLSGDQLILGNGSNEIIELLARGFLREGDRVISSETSFLVYPLITQACGGTYTAVPMKGFRFDLPSILREIDHRTRLIFVANPNNPTGTYVKESEVENFLGRVPDDVIICFDEAYFDFVEAHDFPNLMNEVTGNRRNLILLRTFSKSYGLAGLRIGYGIGSRELIQYLEKIRQPFNVNRMAQAAAAAALDDHRFLRRTKRLVSDGKLYLYRQFTKMGLEFVSSEANFVLVDVGRPAENVFQALLKRGMIIRPMAAYGLPNHIRVTVGRRRDLVKFIRALEKTLGESR